MGIAGKRCCPCMSCAKRKHRPNSCVRPSKAASFCRASSLISPVGISKLTADIYSLPLSAQRLALNRARPLCQQEVYRNGTRRAGGKKLAQRFVVWSIRAGDDGTRRRPARVLASATPCGTRADAERGGGGGIRTHGALADTRDFQSRPLGLYGTPPGRPRRHHGEQAPAYSPCFRADRGGRGGIRTRGALFRHTAFRERHPKPLRHPSTAQYSIPTFGAAIAPPRFNPHPLLLHKGRGARDGRRSARVASRRDVAVIQHPASRGRREGDGA